MIDANGAGPLRIVFLGENWFGSNARACCYALRRAGHEVIDFDSQTFYPQLFNRKSRAVMRLLRPIAKWDYNNAILQTVRALKPDLVLAFRGNYLKRETICSIKELGIAVYNYFPDTSAFSHPLSIDPRCIPEYDTVFYTKPFWLADVERTGLKLRSAVYLDHGYDPEIHHPRDLSKKDSADLERDVAVIGTHSLHKQRILSELVSVSPHLDLVVWGGGWLDHCSDDAVRPFIKGMAICGDSYAKAICATKINLALLSGQVKGSSQGDEITARTFEIPACRGFMLHERTDGAQSLYQEGKEFECFASATELATKIEYYLSHPAERNAIAEAGYRRAVPAYSYDNRMAVIVEHFRRQQHASPTPSPR